MDECKRCSECEDVIHHWIEECDEEGDLVVTCKHCNFEMGMPDETTYIGSTPIMHTFYFVCEGCGTEGPLDLEITGDMRRIQCPEDCGASYVIWNHPTLNEPGLMCVVKPVFAGVAQ